LSAIEARHRDHSAADEERYRRIAGALGLAVSGGSDFHGPQEGRTERDGTAWSPGGVTLGPEDFAALEARRPARGPSGAPRKANPHA
jgi:hypothetical protein